jgi:hypothetical protein
MNEDTRPKAALCVPSGEYWKSMFGFSAFCVAATSAANGISVSIINHRGGDAAENRNRMVDLGRAQGIEWYFFVDADMTFPPDTLVRLLRWNVDVVGADYRMRGAPYDKIGLGPDGKPVPPDTDPAEGLVERSIIGLGCVLVKATVFEKLAEPWFARTWISEHATPDNPHGFSTDDSYFFHYCRHHGFKLWCDMALTHEVQHIGEVTVPWVLKAKRRGDA